MNQENVPAPKIPQIRFHQIKSNFFRVVHADGIWGSVHPSDLVHLTFYNERAPLAKETVHNITEDKQIGDEDMSQRVVRAGYVREMEVDVVLSRSTAASLHKWLDEYLKETLQAPPMASLT